ncbi:MAG: hypothetical protein U9Q05_06250, partial [Thermodesulfobacteriota bacterium]|nr:hypothetical protein [Thermodesulfobacteriota bacterium]
QAVKPGQKPPPHHVSEAIELSTAYLVNANKPSGQFVYRVNPRRWSQTKKRYNVLRHAGTMCALAQAYQRQPNDGVRTALIAAGQFLKSRCMAPLPGRGDMLGIWSLRQVTYTNEPRQIKLGGAGLGLVALVSVEKIIPGTTSLTDLQKLGRFLLYMQKPDGSFYSKFIPSEGGKSDQWTSQYYPGEAALGLLMLNELNPSRRWLVAATKALAYLIKHRDITTTDQWLLIASAKLLSMKSYPTEILSRKLIIQHTVRVCESILQEQILYADDDKYIGGYCIDGRTTPTATRLEGLFAALRIIGYKDAVLNNTMKSSAQAAMNFLLRAQITKGKYSGGIPRAVGRLSSNKAFNRRVREIRIDYVQHALSAMIQYEQMLKVPRSNVSLSGSFPFRKTGPAPE